MSLINHLQHRVNIMIAIIMNLLNLWLLSLMILKLKFSKTHLWKNVNLLLSILEQFILVNGRMNKNMDGENKFGQINQYTKENGLTIRHVEEVN